MRETDTEPLLNFENKYVYSDDENMLAMPDEQAQTNGLQQ